MIAQRLLAEQRVQVAALSAATENLLIHESGVTEAFNTFRQWAQSELHKRDRLLMSFEADMQALKEIKVDPKLLESDAGVPLAHYVPEEKLRTLARDCLDAHGMRTQFKHVDDHF